MNALRIAHEGKPAHLPFRFFFGKRVKGIQKPALVRREGVQSQGRACRGGFLQRGRAAKALAGLNGVPKGFDLPLAFGDRAVDFIRMAKRMVVDDAEKNSDPGAGLRRCGQDAAFDLLLFVPQGVFKVRVLSLR